MWDRLIFISGFIFIISCNLIAIGLVLIAIIYKIKGLAK